MDKKEYEEIEKNAALILTGSRGACTSGCTAASWCAV